MISKPQDQLRPVADKQERSNSTQPLPYQVHDIDVSYVSNHCLRSRSIDDNARSKQTFDTKLFLIELAIYLMVIALVINITPPNLSQRDKYFYVMKYDGVNILKTKITSSSQNKAEVDVDSIYATKLRMKFGGPEKRNNNDDEKKKRCKKANKEFKIHGSIKEYQQYVEEMG